MGVSLSWKPTDPSQGTSFASGSKLHSILENSFGGFPITFTNADVSKLEGIMACGYEDIQDLITAIYKHESVDVEDCWWSK